MAQTEAMLKSMPAMVQANGVDALVLDMGIFYLELGAMQLGMPYVHISNSLPLDFSGYTPLCLYGWPHETTTAALARNPISQGVMPGIRVSQRNCITFPSLPSKMRYPLQKAGFFRHSKAPMGRFLTLFGDIGLGGGKSPLL
jgi:hypothetical protein